MIIRPGLTLVAVAALFIGTVFPASSQTESRQLYDQGVELYKAKQNQEALELLQRFRGADPSSVKSDDALWYIGRLHLRLDQAEPAETAFRQVLSLEESNRHNEAAYDLGRLLYSRKDYPAVIDLLGPSLESTDPDLYERRSMTLMGSAWYFQGLRAKLAYNDDEALKLFSQAAEAYRARLLHEEKPLRRRQAFTDLGKTLVKMMSVAEDGTGFDSYQREAIEVLQEAIILAGDDEVSEEIALLTDAQTGPEYHVEATALGGAENLVGGAGIEADIEIGGVLPFGFRQEVEGRIEYDHDDFSRKSSNFDDVTKTGDQQLIQTTDTLSASLVWQAGDRRGIQNELGGQADIRWAEDPGDDYWSVELIEDGSWRISRDWKLMWDTSFEWKVYPDYLVAGRKLDRYEITASPQIWWRPSRDLDLTLGYEMAYRQYLDSRYDTSTGGIASEDKQYLFNTVSLEVDLELGEVFRPSLGYDLSILETNNYDEYLTSATPGPRFVKDYYDYVRHEIGLDLDFRWSPRLRSQLGASFALRDFTNYPARDETNTYIDETRRDTSIELSSELKYVLWDREGIGRASALLEGRWQTQDSNMTYEATIATNVTYFEVLAGVSVELP